MKKYYPEGARPDIEAVEKRLSSPAELKNAFLSGERPRDGRYPVFLQYHFEECNKPYGLELKQWDFFRG